MKRFKDITEKLGRQLKDPKKEVMVVKKVGGKDKVITIDKSQEKDYLRKGWKLAEDIKEYGGPMVSPAEYKKMGAKMRKAGAPPMSEGRMKELHGYIERGMTAQQIARKMKLDVKTIQALMPSKKESVNENVYKFLVVNTKTGEIESAGSTLDGRNGAKETKKEIEREGKKMQILQLKKKVSDRQMERMLGYTLKQSKIEVGKNATVVEAVSPAQQAAIAIAKKEKGEKPKNESRAYRDAMRSMSRGGTKGMATTKKDKDIEASDDDRKAASKNIIMQLRKAADLPTGAEVEFAKGKGKVDRGTAQAALARFNALAKPRDKEKFQNSIRSLSDIKAILKRK